MHDNTWARALQEIGADVTLVPTYTPIRLDEENVSTSQVFLGGINVYLQHRWKMWRRLPRFMTRWLDAPRVINWATRFGVSNDAKQLGDLTISMLEGEVGSQQSDVDEFTDFIAHKIKPDVVCFSNALLVGTLKRLKQKYSGLVTCTLQGDDIFLEGLLEPYRSRAIELISNLAVDFDAFLVHSRYYREFMSDYLKIPAERFEEIPLGIDLQGHDGEPEARSNSQFTVGYFARVCPEKGLHELVKAFRIFHQKNRNTRLRVGGYLGKTHRDYFKKLQWDANDLGDAFEYVGSPESREEKVAFFKSIDVLSVPTIYREPKGIYVLEALANGVPVIQPRHGAFPQVLEATGGGLLFEPGNVTELADRLEQLMQNQDQRLNLAATGQQRVRSLYDRKTMAIQTLEVFERLLASHRA
jgi:glycosyltransferase involved in cell wall biosynthesis